MSDDEDAHEAQFSKKDALEYSGVLGSRLRKTSRDFALPQEARDQCAAGTDREDSQADSECSIGSDTLAIEEQGPGADCKRETSEEDKSIVEGCASDVFSAPWGPLDAIHEDEEQADKKARPAWLAHQAQLACASPCRSRAEIHPPRTSLELNGSKGSAFHRMCLKVDSLEQRVRVLEIRLAESFDVLNLHIEQQATFRSHEEKAREKITEHFMSALEMALESQQKAIESEIAEFQVNFLASTRSTASCQYASSEPRAPVNIPHEKSSTLEDAVLPTATSAPMAPINGHARTTANLEGTLKTLGNIAGTHEYATLAMNEHLPTDLIKEHEQSTADLGEKLRTLCEDTGIDVEMRTIEDAPQLAQNLQVNEQGLRQDFALLQSNVFEFDQPLPNERTAKEPMDVLDRQRAQYFL